MERATHRGGHDQTRILPELSVRHGRAAIEFSKAAFGAVEEYRVGGTDEEEAVVAQLSVGSASFWVADESPPHQNFSPESLGGGTVRMLLIVEDPESAVARAIAAGAKEVYPVGEEHGWRLGRIEDPFGHHWEIGTPLVAWPPAHGRPSHRGPRPAEVQGSLTDEQLVGVLQRYLRILHGHPGADAMMREILTDDFETGFIGGHVWKGIDGLRDFLSRRAGFFDERHAIDALLDRDREDAELRARTRLHFFLRRWDPPSPPESGVHRHVLPHLASPPSRG
ncbi:MAG TPA: VOC family protein [Thermoleophilaceae bacterium]|jgi:PhnB protein|nr:VOC family protein [Thermoleophilaceae bacterium]